MIRRQVLAWAAAAVTAASRRARPRRPSLQGASQFNRATTTFTKALVRFEELVKRYYGKPVSFVLHRTSLASRRTTSPT